MQYNLEAHAHQEKLRESLEAKENHMGLDFTIRTPLESPSTKL